MPTGNARLIGGNCHGQQFNFPLSSEHLAFIETGDRYTAFLISNPALRKPRTYLVSKDLLDEKGGITDLAISYINDNDLWEWGVE